MCFVNLLYFSNFVSSFVVVNVTNKYLRLIERHPLHEHF